MDDADVNSGGNDDFNDDNHHADDGDDDNNKYDSNDEVKENEEKIKGMDEGKKEEQFKVIKRHNYKTAKKLQIFYFSSFLCSGSNSYSVS